MRELWIWIGERLIWKQSDSRASHHTMSSA